MKKLNLLLIYGVFIASSCNNLHEDGQIYNELKLKPYITMSAIEKATFTDELIRRLKNDRDFVKLNQIQKRLALDWLGRDRSKDVNPPRTKPKNPQERIEYYQKRGVKDPALYFKRQMLSYALLGKVKKKYPELSNLDKKSRAKVFHDASTYPNLKSSLKELYKTKSKEQKQ